MDYADNNDQSQRKGPYEPEQPEMKAACLNEAIERAMMDAPNVGWDEVMHYMEQYYEDKEHNRRVRSEALELLKAVDSENIVLINLIKKFRA